MGNNIRLVRWVLVINDKDLIMNINLYLIWCVYFYVVNSNVKYSKAMQKVDCRSEFSLDMLK